MTDANDPEVTLRHFDPRLSNDRDHLTDVLRSSFKCIVEFIENPQNEDDYICAFDAIDNIDYMVRTCYEDYTITSDMTDE